MRKKASLYQRIYEDLVHQIRSGQCPQDSRLPTEQQLAEAYSVSRITVRHALELLTEEGYIRRIQGSGSVVAKPAQTMGLLGLAMSDFDDVFGTELVKGVIMEADKQGYMVVLQAGYSTPEGEGQCLKRLLQMGVQGIIHVPLYDAAHYTDALTAVSQQVPVVFADRRVLEVDAPLVCTDNVSGVKKLYHTLRDNGCRRVAFISGNPGSTAVGERLKAFQDICRETERNLVLTDIQTMLPGMESAENEDRDTERIAAFLCRHSQIQGVIAHTYYVARLVQKAAKKLHLSIPRDFSLVCFDSRRENADAGEIAYLQQDEFSIGSLAVRHLVDILQGRPVPDVTRVDCKFIDADSYRRLK